MPNIKTVASAHAGKQVCEGPIRSQQAFGSIELWGAATGGTPDVRILSSSSGARKLLAVAPLAPTAAGASGPATAVLTDAVGSGVPVDVCVADRDGEFSLDGDRPSYTGVAISGATPPEAFSLVAFSPHEHSLLGSLSLAFSRASLFRPSWVGAWTFWALLALLLCTVPLGALAISAALRSEDSDGDD